MLGLAIILFALVVAFFVYAINKDMNKKDPK